MSVYLFGMKKMNNLFTFIMDERDSKVSSGAVEKRRRSTPQNINTDDDDLLLTAMHFPYWFSHMIPLFK